MRITTRLLSGALLLLSLTLPAHAVQVAGLYEAEVPVANEDTDSRNQAIAEALQRVLVKVTGRRPAPGGAQLQREAARYVQQFRYRRAFSPAGDPQTNLWVRFDKRGLDRALRGRGLPLWGASRPGVLVWLATETAGRRGLVGVEDALAQQLREAAVARGLPVQLPLLDLEDQARLPGADLWADYAPAVQEASARYSQPLVLTGRLRRVAPDHWGSHWTLYEGEQRESFTARAADAAGAVQAAVDHLAELLAARYAPAGGVDGPQALRVEVIGVRSVQDYAEVLKLIGEREAVERVTVRSTDGDRLLLDVLARGGRDGLIDVLKLVRRLSREPDPVVPPPPVFQSVTPAAQPLPTPAAVPPAGAPAGPSAEGAPVVDGSAAAASPAAPLALPPTPPVAAPQPVVDLVYRLLP